MSGFDPYLIWLDIPPHERPATYYRLLGLRPLESDAQTIAASAQRVIAHVSRFQQTEHAAACGQLLAELTAARDCLLNPVRKQAYDSGFSQSYGSATPAAGPLPTQPISSPERPLHGTPQVPNRPAGERQIASTPPVPQSPGQAPSQTPTAYPSSPLPQAPASSPSPYSSPFPTQPVGNPYPTAPNPQAPNPAGEPAMPSGVPQSALPTPPASPVQPSVTPPSSPSPQAASPQATSPQAPAWAAAQRTGEVGTVVAGQGDTSAQPLGEARTSRGRQLRRAQQTQSAYMLVGIAMALIVFFFGAVLLLAIYMNSQ